MICEVKKIRELLLNVWVEIKVYDEFDLRKSKYVCNRYGYIDRPNNKKQLKCHFVQLLTVQHLY